MKWPTHWPKVVLSLLIVGLESHRWTYRDVSVFANGAEWTPSKKLAARDQVRDLWYHGFNKYMSHGKSARYALMAFPMDELAPLSCKGRGPDWNNPANIAYNDVAGNFSVTLVDALDTFIVLHDPTGFEEAVRNVMNWVSFDVDTKPQVFETTIRVLGGLLSAHLFANQTGQPFYLPWYRGELLGMARDLGDRLLPAFATPTGIPYARLNLRHGLMKGESFDSCTAGAGSLILEFGTLSRLTGDPRFEKAAYKAFFALWNRKSDIGLVGNTINIWTGTWMHPEVSSIGAGIDSFFEYALKWYVMSGEVEFLDVWQEAYDAIMRYARAPDGYWFRSVNIHTGDVSYQTFDSLSAFWPGLQVLAGDVENAIKSHMTYWNIWRAHSGLPEVWDMSFRQGTSMQYPLRPEFVESTWYLYRATRDPFYLDVAGRVLYDITTRAKVPCGLAGIGDLRTNKLEDRMESFVLSETLKYLYLLFDEENLLNTNDSNYVLTTEGHILWLDRDLIKPMSPARRKLRGAEHHQCPAYEPPLIAFDDWDAETGMTTNIRARSDADFVRELIGVKPTSQDAKTYFPGGWCEIPKMALFSYDFILSPNGQNIPEDMNPGAGKLGFLPDGYILHNISGIRAHIVSRLDGQGYDITKLGPYTVKTGQLVYVDDPELVLVPQDGKDGNERTGSHRIPEVNLRFYLEFVDPLFLLQPGTHDMATEVFVTASTALFGGDPTLLSPTGEPVLRFGRGDGSRLVREHSNSFGCQPYNRTFHDNAVLVMRGECTFLEKLVHARRAGASGVIVISDEETKINPSSDLDELVAVQDLINDAVVVVLKKSVGEVVSTLLSAAEEAGIGQVVVAVEPEAQPATNQQKKAPSEYKDTPRVLFLNGHPLLNTRLMV
ncbi:glycoside hydrolase family 47 protein [Wolfiporia cocos MD-104 SS10]|uniref:alpha-1,2-Mannosidase n=1 Tax=Wolfiporia cocos (strain MD-104) TaxID=742152 RepID=A0A2H3JHZ9_WOLCO|nr:glycoside hydrolase family 47 protein [Wolfiporia cocos MD-104 SS10]